MLTPRTATFSWKEEDVKMWRFALRPAYFRPGKSLCTSACPRSRAKAVRKSVRYSPLAHPACRSEGSKSTLLPHHDMHSLLRNLLDFISYLNTRVRCEKHRKACLCHTQPEIRCARTKATKSFSRECFERSAGSRFSAAF